MFTEATKSQHPSRGTLPLAVIALLLLGCVLPVLGAQLSIRAKGTFARMTSVGRVVVKKDFAQTPFEEDVVLKLKGIVIPAVAIPRAASYASALTRNCPLTMVISAKTGKEYVSEVFVHRSSNKAYSLNKTFLVYGFAYLDRSDPDCQTWAPYEASARRNKWGIWSEGKGKWPAGTRETQAGRPAAPRVVRRAPPRVVRQAAPRVVRQTAPPVVRQVAPQGALQRPVDLPDIGGDRRAIVARYGYPDQTMTTYGRASLINGTYIAPGMFVFDRYTQLGLIFIYRNGKLVEKRDAY